MSAHPPLSPSMHAHPLPMPSPAPLPASPVHLPAPRPVRFASFHGPWPSPLQPHARPAAGRSQSFDPSDRLREAMAALSFDPEQQQQLTPSPSTPPDYLLELLSIFSPPIRVPAPPTLPLPLPPGKLPTPPPRPSAPFRHRRHPSATSLLLDAHSPTADGERVGRKGSELPYWKPTAQVREAEARKRRSGTLRRSTSGSASGAASPISPTSPEPDHPLLTGLLALAPRSDTPGQGLPTPVSVPADPRVLGFPFPEHLPLPLPVPPALAGPLLPPQQGGHMGQHTQEPEQLEAEVRGGLSPRAFLLREMKEEQEDLAAAVAAAAAVGVADAVPDLGAADAEVDVDAEVEREDVLREMEEEGEL